MTLPAQRAFLAPILFTLCTAAVADALPKSWNEFTTVTLIFSEGDSRGTTWSGVFDHKTNDFLLDVQVREPEPMKGSVGMVGGRFMVSRGLTLRRGHELDAIDGPVLSMRLALTVLGRLFPDGPDTVKGLEQVGRDDDVGIRFATPSASGTIAAPWRVSGSVENYNAGAVTFDLAMTVPAQTTRAKAATGTLNLKGRLGMRTEPVFREDASLEGWSVYRVGRQATPAKAPGLKTIADLRASIAEKR